MTAPFNVLTQARHGQLLYNRHDRYIGRALELYGEWSEGEIAVFRQVLRPGMVAVDAGANIGTHTVPLARAVAPGGLVYAFEPQRIVFQTLAANVALNSLTNVICQQRALGAAPGVARVPPLDYTAANNFGGVELAGADPAGAAALPGEPVEVVRLDDFELAACHLLKIDVEGMELAVLEGAAATIARCQPILYVEADRAANRDALVRWLDAHGYVAYWHQVPLYNPDNFRGNRTNVFEGIVSLNLLAIPTSVPQQVAGLERARVPVASGAGEARADIRRLVRSARAARPLRRSHAPTDRSGRSASPTGGAGRWPAGEVGLPPRRTAEGGRGDAVEQPGDEAGSPPRDVEKRGAGDEVRSDTEVRGVLERAVALHQAGQPGEAARLYAAVLAARPDEPDALHLLGLIRREERQLDAALALIGRAASLAPHQPLFHFNLGAVCRQAGLLPEAEQSLRRALALSPGSIEARLELGLTLLDRRDLEAAEAMLREGLALAPDHAPTHFALAGLLLLAGRYQEGWREYAWRWRLPELVGAQPAARAPRWQGEPLAGRAILLESEQGYGDTIQFARYVPLVAARGGRVIVRCRPEIQPLLATLDGVSGLVGPGEPLPPLDAVAALPDLPRLFDTTLEAIPGPVPYLRADPARALAWQARLDAADAECERRGTVHGARATEEDADRRPAGPVRRVGLVWAGSPDHRLNGQRSTTLAAFAPLAEVAGVRFYGLQKRPAAAEALAPPAGLDLVDLGPHLADFADTAAVLSLLDLVITVDTSVGHLAGALGRPAWILPWATHDWRWLLNRDDTPWYPSVRLFRQERPNAWQPVVARVAEALRRWRRAGAL